MAEDEFYHTSSEMQKPSKSREYNIIEEISCVKGKVEFLDEGFNDLKSQIDQILVLQQKEPDIDSIVDKSIQSKSMANNAKNKLTFSGRSDEDISKILTRLSFLKTAHSWNDSQYYGQTLVGQYI